MNRHRFTCSTILVFLGTATVVAIFSFPVIGQTVNKVPLSSEENTIELTVANQSDNQAATDISLHVADHPAWMKIDTTDRSIKTIPAQGEFTVRFPFTLTRNAPIGSEARIRFDLSTPSGDQWSKDIMITVVAPIKYSLDQNYPNPFNPQTTIQFMLPTDSHVKIRVFNALGQLVASLLDDIQPAGLQLVEWNASGVASGVYYYRMEAVSLQDPSKTFVDTKKVLLMK